MSNIHQYVMDSVSPVNASSPQQSIPQFHHQFNNMIPSYNHLLPSKDFTAKVLGDKDEFKCKDNKKEGGRNKQNENEIREMLKENNIKNAIVL